MFFTIQQIKDANKNAGQFWFLPKTMRFFKTRIYPRVFIANERMFFISSEKGPSGVRAYTIREAFESGKVETPADMGGFQAYPTLGRAKTVLKRYRAA